MIVNSLLKFSTLVALSNGPKHGYELIKYLERQIEKNVSPSQVYPFLNTLKKAGYLKITETDSRDKKTYNLTPIGKQFVEKLLRRWEDVVSFAVHKDLVSCDHCGCEVYKGSYNEKIKGKQYHFCCTHCAESFKKDCTCCKKASTI